MTKEEFIEKSISVWGNIYTYEKTSIIDWHVKVTITCKLHGDFSQSPSNHLKGYNGCKMCKQKENKCDYDSFIERANKIHKNKFDYSLINRNLPIPNKIHIICPTHGEFTQYRNKHLAGRTCLKCSRENMRYDTDEFIKKSNEIHKNKYNYDLVEYVDSKTKVKIFCPEHGVFMMAPEKHMQGQKCRGCSKRERISKETFIERANKKHNNKYDYSNVDFKKITDKVEIICPIHGKFKQQANSHLLGKGCSACAGNIIYTPERFILSANNIHNNKFDYSEIKFKTLSEKIIIICPIHGKFEQTAANHLSGRGCRFCKKVQRDSKGSKKIESYLINKNIYFEKEFRFDDCKNKKKLPFDFKITVGKIEAIIEFNGLQHFKRTNWSILENVQRNDKIKREYCKSKNIPLLDINYNEEHLIPEKINTFIKMLEGDHG